MGLIVSNVMRTLPPPAIGPGRLSVRPSLSAGAVDR